jgi:hypothetical protein
VSVSARESRPGADEVLPPLKKGVSTDHSTALQAIFPVPVSTQESRPADEVLPPLKKGASTDDSTGILAIFPVLTLTSLLTDDVLPPLKKGASTDNSTALQTIFSLSALALTSLLTDEVLAPLKEGAITHNSLGLSSMIVPAFAASIQQSTIPTFATTDATNHPIEREDDSLIRDMPSNLICHVSKKGGIKSPRSIPKTVSNQAKGHGDKFQIKRSTDHW